MGVTDLLWLDYALFNREFRMDRDNTLSLWNSGRDEKVSLSYSLDARAADQCWAWELDNPLNYDDVTVTTSDGAGFVLRIDWLTGQASLTNPADQITASKLPADVSAMTRLYEAEGHDVAQTEIKLLIETAWRDVFSELKTQGEASNYRFRLPDDRVITAFGSGGGYSSQKWAGINYLILLGLFGPVWLIGIPVLWRLKVVVDRKMTSRHCSCTGATIPPPCR